MRINFNEPKFGEEEVKEVIEVIRTGFINEGPKTKELEERIKNYLNVKHVIMTVNATAALFLAIKADAVIRKVKDFEVIVPDLTMIASATAVEWAGGKPILVDVEKDRATIDVNKIEEKINARTISIIPVHILGRSCNMEKIEEISKRHNLTIIEDAAGALGSKNNGKFLGTFGKVGCFSLQSNKIVSCGQGGIIVTNDDEYYEVMKRFKDFGRFNKEFFHDMAGYNLKFNDLLGGLGLAQFRKIEERKILLKEQRAKYEKELSDLEEIKFFPLNYEEVPLWIDVMVEERENLVKHLNSFEIFPRECWPSIHKNKPYQNQGNDSIFPVSSKISDNCLWLPNGPAVSFDDIKLVCQKIKDFYKKIKLQKIHQDQRGFIYVLKDMLEGTKEFNILEIKKGYARGGCLHSNDEYFVVIKGKIKYICGNEEKEIGPGKAEVIPALKPHAFIALEDSIVSEWGITTEEKERDIKDPKLREIIDKINKK